ncbi:MAG: hypothetical protein NT121_20420 [Chloroflexi bacterium]|nr:hypothetical protein [Chloroflexota bacterium]
MATLSITFPRHTYRAFRFSMLFGFIGFGLTFTSGTVFLVRLGEIA